MRWDVLNGISHLFVSMKKSTVILCAFKYFMKERIKCMKRWRKCLSGALSAVLAVSAFGIPVNVQAADGLVTDDALSQTAVEAPAAWGAVPNEEQLYYMKSGLSAFCHFGPNTFNNVEWGESYGTRTPDDIFKLTEKFDADNLVRTVKEAGFSRIMLTAKHHDGFCLWDSGLTDYGIGSTAYDGDILEEISDACTKYNLDMGLYLSPWDIHEDKYGCFGNNNNRENYAGYTDYNKLYIDWIDEICTAKKADGSYKYGNNSPDRRSDRFVEWWMDGAQGSNSNMQSYDWKGIFEVIRKTNPHCQIFGTHAAVNGKNGAEDKALASTGGIHWIGNEEGKASGTTWAKVTAGESYEDTSLFPRPEGAIEGKPDGNQWSVPEVDVKMLAGWFWRDSAGDNTTKSEKDLADIYFRSVGRGAALLLNLSPNKTGAVGEEQLGRFVQLGENIKETFDEDLTKAEGVTAAATSVWGSSKAYSPLNVLDEIPEGELYDETYWAPAQGETTGSLEISLGGLKTFDVVSMEEYIQKGQSISSWSVEYKDITGTWKEFDKGTTISAKRLCRKAPVEGTHIRINILSAYSTPMIANVGVFKASEGFEAEAENAVKLPTNLKSIPITEFDLDASWILEENDTSAWSNATKNGEASFTFAGTQAWIFGTKDPNHGTMDIYIDGEKAGSVDTRADSRSMGVFLYRTPELSYGSHTVRVVCTKGAIGLGGARYADGSGIFVLGQKEKDLLYGGTTEVEILRTNGSRGEVTVSYTTESAGAEQGVNYVNLTDSVTFAEGETSKKITLTGLENNRSTDGKDFYFVLMASSEASIGENSYTHVTLYTPKAESVLEMCRKVDTENYTRESAAAFRKAYEALEACCRSAWADETVKKEAAKAAFAARDGLVLRDGYTEAEPFVFPVKGEKDLEAEDFTLDASQAVDPSCYVRIAQKDYGTVVDWFEDGNKITLPFYAAKTGTYRMTVSYRSGRLEESGNPNALNWGGTNVESGSLEVYGEDGAVSDHRAEFTVKVTEAGAGSLVFTADSKGGPVLDWFKLAYTGTETLPVQGVALNHTSVTLTKDAPCALLWADVQPADADNREVLFTSSAPDVAAVDANGVVKALKRGTAVITAVTKDGGKQAQCSIRVDLPEEKPEPKPPVKEDPPAREIWEGKICDDGTYSYKVTSLKKQTVEITGAKKSQKAIKIPHMVKLAGKSFQVTSVGAAAFKNQKKAASLTVGKYVQVIGKEAFAGCAKLTKVTVQGNSLRQIGAKAFYNCKKLKTITIKSKAVKSVGKNALKGIYKKAVIKVPASKVKAYQKIFRKKSQNKAVRIKK